MELERKAVGIPEPNMKEMMEEMYYNMQESSKKKIKIPRKAKVSKGQMKKGWIGTIYIDENGNIRGDKTKLSGNVTREKKDIKYHATTGEEILMWEGKYPVTLQPTWRVNPINVKKIDDKNETYGQQYIMARMLADVIKIKKGGGMSILLLVGLAVAGYIGYTFITGG